MFYAKPHWLKIGCGKYCSVKCQREGQKTGKFVKCSICNKAVYRPLKQLKGSKSKKYFCNKSCQTIWRNTTFVGRKHGNWKDGTNTYRTILKRHAIPMICVLCKTMDTRVLAVHHIDKNKRNNRLSNLAWLCHNCHFLVHHHEGEKQKFMVSIA